MKRPIAILLLLSFVAFFASPGTAENGDKPEKAKKGFIRVPAGTVQPGCTRKDYKTRADDPVKGALFEYEIWAENQPPVTLPAFLLQKFELTNAQWKLYLDRNFRVTHKTTGQDTLQALAKKYIKHGSEELEEEWKAIYALNWRTIYDALKAAPAVAGQPLWNPDWKPERPGVGIRGVFLPADLELHFYSHVVPKHWYGWCSLSGLSAGREYCDVTAAPQNAFLVPDDEMFKALRLHGPADQPHDYKNYPMRDLAALEALAMAEWAGCNLPTEYELERAMRGGAPNSKQHPGPAPWDRNKERERFVYAENPHATGGPLPVDDQRVASGDTEFGHRHMIGNVWELTSTFWDLHPGLMPKPDTTASLGLFNYALTAKGGAWGSGWRELQISTRTGMFSDKTTFDLRYLNRADSLGMRLARHEQPGYDLMTHTVRRMSFTSGLGMWNPTPHEYAWPRLTGADVTHFVDSSAEDGYCFVQEKALGVAFVPMWAVPMAKVDHDKQKQMKRPIEEYYLLGVLRLDTPFRAGKRLTEKEWEDLVQARKDYLKQKKEIEAANKKLKKGQQPQPLPPAPPEPDEYEQQTTKLNKPLQSGVWREAEFPPNEYYVVYWQGFIGLMTRAKRTPPEAILIPSFDKAVRRISDWKGKTFVDRTAEKFDIEFSIEEWTSKKPPEPPGADKSDLWALSLTLPEGWDGRKVNKGGWQFKFSVPTVKGELAKHRWNTEADGPADAAESSRDDSQKDGDAPKIDPEEKK